VQQIQEYFGYVNEAIFGLDISSTSVKLINIDKVDGKYIVQNYGVEPLAPGLVVEKNIRNIQGVVDAIKKVLDRSEINIQQVAVAIPSTSAITRIVKTRQNQSDDDIAAEIELDSDRYIPYPIDEVNFDFQVIGTSADDPEFSDVLVVASRKENINVRVEAIEKAGLIPSIVEVDTFSLQRAFSMVFHQLPKQSSNVVALFDIGSSTTSMNVFDNSNLVYTREQAFGGIQLTQEIQERYGLTYQEAIMAKKYSDLPDDYSTEILEPFKERVAQQVSRACQFFFSSGEYNQVNHIVLCGGTSSIYGLDTMISKLLDTKTYIANPFVDMLLSSNVNVSLINDDAPSLMTCTGLALRNFIK